MNFCRVLFCFPMLGVVSVCGLPVPAKAQEETLRKKTVQESTVDFNRDIRGLLFGKCVTCHGPDEEERAAGLRLDTEAGAHEHAVVPGDASASELIARITSNEDEVRMPPPGKGDPLTPAEAELLQRWINQGGRYAPHWSYLKPVRPEPPSIDSDPWATNAIDHFVFAKMRSQGLQPAPAADRLTIARRVALDLTGLPPAWPQAQAFVQDSSAEAYEKYVDSLLANPAFGERWAQVWLDLARYADSAGYADDPERTIWAYRDYVITALNENMPFDQFTVEQIAGDLMDEPTQQSRIATAFHRNTMTNNEGGTNDEEFRAAAVVDRVNTTMAVWMGTTMACAQCHTHKYDPITHEDYFSFYAFFNQTADRDARDERPTLEVWSDDQVKQQTELKSELARLDRALHQSTPEWVSHRDAWVESVSQTPAWFVCDATPIPDRNRYRLQWPTDAQPVTALKLQTLDSQTENLLVRDVSASFVPDTAAPTRARYIRVELPGKDRHLHLAEIEAFAGDDNIARSGKATQVSTYADAVATRVNDGNTDGDYEKQSVQHTLATDDAWVEIDLQSTHAIDRIVLWNRTDGGPGIQSRLNGFVLKLLDEDRRAVANVSSDEESQTRYEFDFTGSRRLTFLNATVAKLPVEPDRNTGGALNPPQGQPSEFTLPLSDPLPPIAGILTVEIAHDSVAAEQLRQPLGVLATTDAGVTARAHLPQSIGEIVSLEANQWTASQLAAVDAYYRTIAPLLEPLRIKRTELTDRLERMKPMTTVPVMQDLPPEQHRVTRIQLRGNYLSTSETVQARTPEAFHPIEHSKDSEPPDRLALAHWLVSSENPLTARVIANRHWEQIFGVGIVETSEEFGSQGELPSHPELLDWLAVELQESGWNLKHLIKLMVMSSTYRQRSNAHADALESDPHNRWLARGPRFRVSAETIRDQTLSVSGLLSHKRFGPPVKPPQPSLGLKAAFGGATDWTNSEGENRYRRGLYTTWRRSSPYPSMAQFDAPNREVCTVRRIRTNTPLQALVTLNDPVYVEAAQALARKMVAASDDPADRIRLAFHDCLTREPSDSESQRLIRLALQAQRHYAERPEDAVAMATDPIGPLPSVEPEPAAVYAAWTTVANVILNLDEMMMKR